MKQEGEPSKGLPKSVHEAGYSRRHRPNRRDGRDTRKYWTEVFALASAVLGVAAIVLGWFAADRASVVNDNRQTINNNDQYIDKLEEENQALEGDNRQLAAKIAELEEELSASGGLPSSTDSIKTSVTRVLQMKDPGCSGGTSVNMDALKLSNDPYEPGTSVVYNSCASANGRAALKDPAASVVMAPLDPGIQPSPEACEDAIETNPFSALLAADGMKVCFRTGESHIALAFFRSVSADNTAVVTATLWK